MENPNHPLSPLNPDDQNKFPIPEHPEPGQPNAAIENIPRFHNPAPHSPGEQVHPINQSNSPQPATPPQQHPAPTHATAPQPPQLDPEKLKKREKARKKLEKIRKHPHWRTVRFALISFLLFVIIFNFPLIYSQIIYWTSARTTTPTTQTNQNTTQQQAQTTTTTTTQQAEVVGPENLIIIPKINVRAPIVFVETLNEAEILKGLQDGVVHYAGTANPGENGNAVLFGHSSNDWWQPGGYKFVFVLLEKLTVGDTYEIHFQSRKYVYKIVETKVVAPNDLSVLTQTTTPFSTLITCTPPGTSWRRFVVKAEQIAPSPAPVTTVVTTPPPTEQLTQPSVLPSASASVFEQIGQFFSSLWNRFFGRDTSTSDSAGEASTGSATPNHLPESF